MYLVDVGYPTILYVGGLLGVICDFLTCVIVDLLKITCYDALTVPSPFFIPIWV